MDRWLGVDFGTVRVGIAVGSDGGIVSPLAVLDSGPMDILAGQIAQLARDYQAAGIVVGLPLNMDNTEGPQAKLTRQAAADLAERIELDVRLWDERLSSFEADAALAGRLTRKKRKARQDALAAGAILRDFFAGNGPQAAAQAKRPDDPE
ncbi:MAG: Holliday junction resolvase RuvX [Phycisphaerae bacterium]